MKKHHPQAWKSTTSTVMKKQPPPMTDEQLDQLLATNNRLQLPADFEQRIMQEINNLPEQTKNTQRTTHWWQLAGLLGAGIPGIAQIISFIFSIWSVSSAG